MAKLYLHIGMDKTGTSAIQNYLFINKDRLLTGYALLYPDAGMWLDYSHHKFAFSIMEMHGYRIGDLDELFNNLKREMSDDCDVLISSECLFKAPNKNGFAEFKRQLDELFHKIIVIVYVRRQDEWVESRYRHSIVSETEIDIDKLSGPWFCNYKQHIDKWAEIVGKDNVIVRPYERQQFVGGSIYSDFLYSITDIQNDGLVQPHCRVNASFGPAQVAFKRLCNKVGLTRSAISRFQKLYNKWILDFDVIDCLNGILISNTSQEQSEVRHVFLSHEKRVALMDMYRCINQEIAREYLSRSDDVLFFSSPQHERAGEVYQGLNSCEINMLMRFVREQNKHVYKQIISSARKSVKSADPDVRMAAEMLLSAAD